MVGDDPEDDGFRDAAAALRAGDFSRLEPLFEEVAGQPAAVQRWWAEGRFESEFVAAAEALTCACFLGKVHVANYLLQRGVSPAGGMGTGLNAMHWAANRGQVEAVRLLLQWRAPLDVRSMYGGNVLDTAVWSAINEPREGQLAVIDVLLDAGARLADEQYPTGREAVDMMFKQHGAV